MIHHPLELKMSLIIQMHKLCILSSSLQEKSDFLCRQWRRNGFFDPLTVVFQLLAFPTLMCTYKTLASCKLLCRTSNLSIYGIYIAPLQGNYSEALSAQAWPKIKILRSL